MPCQVATQYHHSSTLARSPYMMFLTENELCVNLCLLCENDVDAAMEVGQTFVTKNDDRKGKMQTTYLNKLLAKMCYGKGNETCRLPPYKDSFKEHLKRSMRQTKLWRTAHLPMPFYGNVKNFGWQMKSSMLQPVFYTGL